MRSLVVDSRRFAYTPTGFAGEIAEGANGWEVGREKEFHDVIVVFVAIEEKDKRRQEIRMANEIVKLFSELKGDKVLIMPNVHLAQDHIAVVPLAMKRLDGLKARIEREGIAVFSGPFGTYGVWEIASQPTHNSTLGRSF